MIGGVTVTPPPPWLEMISFFNGQNDFSNNQRCCRKTGTSLDSFVSHANKDCATKAAISNVIRTPTQKIF